MEIEFGSTTITFISEDAGRSYFSVRSGSTWVQSEAVYRRYPRELCFVYTRVNTHTRYHTGTGTTTVVLYTCMYVCSTCTQVFIYL